MPKSLACLLLTLLCVLCCIETRAADKEQREPTQPAFSGVGARLVYVEEVTPPGEVLPATGEIWTISFDGTDARRLTHGFKDSLPRFSPDGKQIVFVRDMQLWLINADGTNLRRVSDTKAHFNQGAEFSNDGKSLFFMRPVPLDANDEDLKEDPFLVFGVGDVPVQYDLQTGRETVLLSEEYHVSQIAPNPADDDTVWIICQKLDVNGKPQAGAEKNVAKLSLKEKTLRPFYMPDKNYSLTSLRASVANFVLALSPKDKIGNEYFLLEKDTLQKVEKLGFVGDVDLAGLSLVGTALNDRLQWQLVFYDVQTKAATPVLKKEKRAE